VSVLLGDRGRLRRLRRHLANHDVTLCAVSRAPLAKLQTYKRGWAGASLGVFVRQRLQLRLPSGAHQGAVAVGSRRVQLRAMDVRPAEAGEESPFLARSRRALERTGRRTGEKARRERVRARGWRRIPHLLSVRARAGRPLEYVPVARPRATRRNETGFWWRRHDEYDSQ